MGFAATSRGRLGYAVGATAVARILICTSVKNPSLLDPAARRAAADKLKELYATAQLEEKQNNMDARSKGEALVRSNPSRQDRSLVLKFSIVSYSRLASTLRAHLTPSRRGNTVALDQCQSGEKFRPGDTSFSGCLFARLSFVPLFFPLVDRAEGG